MVRISTSIPQNILILSAPDDWSQTFILVGIYRCSARTWNLKLLDFRIAETKRRINAFPKYYHSLSFSLLKKRTSEFNRKITKNISVCKKYFQNVKILSKSPQRRTEEPRGRRPPGLRKVTHPLRSRFTHRDNYVA